MLAIARDTRRLLVAVEQAAEAVLTDAAARTMSPDAVAVYFGLLVLDRAGAALRLPIEPEGAWPPVLVSVHTDAGVVAACPASVITVLGAVLACGWHPPQEFPAPRSVLQRELRRLSGQEDTPDAEQPEPRTAAPRRARERARGVVRDTPLASGAPDQPRRPPAPRQAALQAREVR